MSPRRVLAGMACAGLLVGGLAGATGRDGDEGRYLVRAVFDNGSFVVPGEDVKVAGIKVGKIHDLDLTADHKAVVVLDIEDPAFRPFRADAHCQIRLQSLIGEQFIECAPTLVRDGSAKPKPPLRQIASGPGAGQHLLPVENNTTPVGVDLINNITRLPQQERLRLIINEFGAGLAGNGERLRGAIRRANPALRELERVAAVLAGQDKLLARLVDQSDTVLRPFAKRRRQLAGFIDHSGATAEASAARGDDLEANFRKLPPFLRELGPTMDRFAGMAGQMSPALDSLAPRAAEINQMVERFGPFVEASGPALRSLGDTARAGRRVFPAIRPLVGDLRRLSRPLAPLSGDLAALSQSFDASGGVENLMRFIYFYTGAVNGEDQYGHYTRTGLNISNCVRAPTVTPGCGANFQVAADSSAASARASMSPKSAKAAGSSKDRPGRNPIARDAKSYGVPLEDAKADALLEYLLGSDDAQEGQP